MDSLETPSLLQALDAPELSVRLDALRAVLAQQDRSVIDKVAERIDAEKNAKVRLAMIFVIGKLGGRVHCGVLVRQLKAADADVRYRAVEALARIGDPECYPLIVRALAADSEAKVRDLSANYLLRLGRDELLALLKRMLRSENPWMRRASILACQRFNSPAVVPLLKLAYIKEVGKLKEAALTGLNRLASLGNDAAAAAIDEFERSCELPPLTGAVEGEVDAAKAPSDLDATYTGRRLPPQALELTPFGSQSQLPQPPPASGLDEEEPRPRTSGRIQRRAPSVGARVVARSSNPAADAPAAAETDRAADADPNPGAAPAGSGEVRTCPVCGEDVLPSARRCQFCNERLSPTQENVVQQITDGPPPRPPLVLTVLTLAYVSLQVATVVAYAGGAEAACPWGWFQAFLAMVASVAATLCRLGFRGAWRAWCALTCVLALTGLVGFLAGAVALPLLATPAVRRYCVR